MKIDHHTVHVVDSHGLGEQRKFRILSNSHSFRILSSGLYSDKISACLRELGCNAADSHIAAGIPQRPIEVKLPSKLDREFYIRDFGTGLSHDDIEQLYTTYFSSNKGANNEQTGAFGLGSKSPFSYTDSFAVTTAQDGVQRAYSAYIGPDGSPVIVLMDERPSSDNWPHGLMVSFPVKPEDVTEFERKAQQVFRWFQVKPVWPGVSESPYREFERGLSGSNFFFVKGGTLGLKDRGHYHIVPESAHIMSGNVAYPLEVRQLESEESFVKLLIDAGIQLRMPLGSVMMTASREALEYDPRTRTNVIEALRAAAAEIGVLLRAKLEEPAVSDWQRRHQAHCYLDTHVPSGIASDLNGLLEGLDLSSVEREQICSFYQTRSKLLPEWVGGDAYRKIPAAADSAVSFASEIDRTASYHVWWAHYGADERRHAVNHGMIKLGKKPERASVWFSQQLKILIADCSHAYPRVRAELRRTPALAVLMIAPAYPESQAGLAGFAQKLSDELGGAPVVNISTLPMPNAISQRAREAQSRPKLKPSEKAAAYAKEKVRFWEVREDRRLPSRIAFGEVPEDSRFYLPAPSNRNGETTYDAPVAGYFRGVLQSDLETIVLAFRSLRALGVPVPEIGGFITPEGPQARKFKLKENGWKPLLEVIYSSLADPAIVAAIQGKVICQPDLALERSTRYACPAGMLESLIRLAHSNPDAREWLTNLEEELPALAVLTRPLWDSNVLSENNASADRPLQCLINALGYSTSLKFERVDCQRYFEQVLSRHPELRFVSADHFADCWREDPEGAARLLRLIFNQ